jgi:hypothetical protein
MSQAPNASCDYCKRPLVFSDGNHRGYDPITKKQAKRGWTNAIYCSRWCDERGYMACVSSMPRAGPCNSIPPHIKIEMNLRWQDT